MENNNVPVYARIDLKPIGKEKFYLHILPEETQEGVLYGAWVFRENYGIAVYAYGATETSCNVMDVEHIKELDGTGYFDEIKKRLLKE